MSPIPDENHIPLAVSRDRRQVDRWALTLSAKDIPHELYNLPDGWTLYVGASDVERAEDEIARYESDERERRQPRRWPVYFPDALPGLFFVLGALAFFHFWTYAPPGREFWLAAGRASATRIGDGEWWRAVTALTLHADVQHLASNLVFGGINAWALRRLIGSGRAWLCILLAGTGGNLLNALFYGSAHNAIGASTAVFGAVGVLAAVQLDERFRLPRTRLWIPFGSGLALLAMLGSSERTDVWAHFFGFFAGLALGAAAIPLLKRDLLTGDRVSLFLSLASLAAVLLAWGAAFFG